MIGWRPPSSLGNFACRLRKDESASLSLFCEESCTTNPPDALLVPAVAPGSPPPWGSSEIGPLLRAAGAAALGAAGGATRPIGLALASLPSGRMVTVRSFLGSPVAAAAGGGSTGWDAGSFSATGSSCFDTNCSLPGFTTTALPDCGSPVAGTILVG